MGSFYTESSYNFGTNSAQFPADRERHRGEDANDTKERPRAVQRRGRERYKGEDASGTRERPRAIQRRDRERYKGEDASGTKERTRAVQRRGRERYKGEDASGTRKTKRTLLQETGRMIPCLPQYRPPFVYGQSEESSV